MAARKSMEKATVVVGAVEEIKKVGINRTTSRPAAKKPSEGDFNNVQKSFGGTPPPNPQLHWLAQPDTAPDPADKIVRRYSRYTKGDQPGRPRSAGDGPTITDFGEMKRQARGKTEDGAEETPRDQQTAAPDPDAANAEKAKSLRRRSTVGEARLTLTDIHAPFLEPKGTEEFGKAPDGKQYGGAADGKLTEALGRVSIEDVGRNWRTSKDWPGDAVVEAAGLRRLSSKDRRPSKELVRRPSKIIDIEEVFKAILGDPPKSVAECSEGELVALARSLGITLEELAMMNREEMIAVINEKRKAFLLASGQRALEACAEILGNPPKSVADCSEEELLALTKALGIDPEALAKMSREEMTAVINERRNATLLSALSGRGAREAFKLILGDPPKPLAECSDGELMALARALGIALDDLATMNREEMIAVINDHRDEALAAECSVAGVCEIVEAAMKAVQARRIQIEAEAKGASMVKCPHCGCKIRRDALQQHVTDCPEREVLCSACGEMVKKKDLKKHAGVCSVVPKPCPDCGVMLPRGDMVSHRKICVLRKMKCSWCNEEFSAFDLEKHSRMCGSRKRKCEWCHRSISAQNLSKHIQLCALREKTCQICGLKVPQMHMQEHLALGCPRPPPERDEHHLDAGVLSVEKVNTSLHDQPEWLLLRRIDALAHEVHAGHVKKLASGGDVIQRADQLLSQTSEWYSAWSRSGSVKRD